MIDRELQTAIDGSVFSSKITIEYEDDEGKDIVIFIDPEAMYGILRKAIVRMSTMGADNNSQSGRLAKLIKVGIKGLLIMYGNQLLDELFHTKDHPKPGKGDDLLDWYTDMFTRIGLSYLMRNDTIVKGYTRSDSPTRIVEADTVFTRPISAREGKTTTEYDDISDARID